MQDRLDTQSRCEEESDAHHTRATIRSLVTKKGYTECRFETVDALWPLSGRCVAARGLSGVARRGLASFERERGGKNRAQRKSSRKTTARATCDFTSTLRMGPPK